MMQQKAPPIKNTLPEIENRSFRESRQVYELRRKLEEQKDTIQELVQLVRQSKTETHKPLFNQQPITPQSMNLKPENDQITLQLLEEVKTLRKQINNIEQGPRASPVQQPIFIPQYLPSPPQLQQQPQQQQLPPYMYMNPYFPMPPYMYQKPKTKDDPYKKLVMQMLLKNTDGSSRKNRLKNSIYSDESEDQYDRTRPNSQHRHYSQKDRDYRRNGGRDKDRDRNKDKDRDRDRDRDKNNGRDRDSTRDRDKNRQNQNRTSKGSLHDSYVSNFTRSSAKTRVNKKKQRDFTDEEKLNLKRRLIGLFWFVRVGLGLKKYLKNIWLNRRQEYYENEAQQMIEKFDSEFNYKEVFILFVVECNKNKYFTKNWVFFDNQEVPQKCNNLFQIVKVLFKKLPFMSKNTLSEEHKAFIRKISTPNGYLLPGHPLFVTDRVQLRPNVTIGPINAEVSKMIQMDYVYIQVLVQRVILIHEWYSQFSKIPNHKQAMKILSTVLHQLFIDHFSSLPSIENQDAIYNTQQIVYCDFNQFNYIDVAISIDDKNPKYQPTTSCCILGLGSKEEMQPLYDQPGYKELQTLFKEYCDYFYSSINS